jgi:hypothetical protein
LSPRKILLTALGCAAAVYGLAYGDLVLRARSAYLEGEKYLEWNRHPELKQAYYDGALAQKEAGLQKDFDAGKLTKEELDMRLELARFERDERVKESSLKYAYVWFQTAAQLFSPPESKWVVLSRERMAQTKELWKKELDEKHVHYEDYMFE